MLGRLASTAAATIALLAGSAPSLNATVSEQLPEVGQCYNMSKSQFNPTTRNLGSIWPGGRLTSCSQRHRAEVFETGWIPGDYLAKSDGTQARYAGWQCRKAQMKHGPLTRLNGLAVSWFLVNTGTPADQTGRRFVCLAAMGGKNPGTSVRSTKPFALSDDAGPVCASLKGRSSIWSACRKGSYQLTQFKLLDPTFQASYPGVKATDRRASRACKPHSIYSSPPSTSIWNDYPFADCYQKI